MYCTKCGRELDHDAHFCPACGVEQTDNAFGTTNATEIDENKPAKVWKVFSIIGKIAGIVAICLCWVPYDTIFFGIVAIVFSCLGKKYHTVETDKNFKVGLTLGIIATVTSFLVGVILSIVSVVLEYSWWIYILEHLQEILEYLFN